MPFDPDKPRRPCVQHQIGRCLAPCAGLVSQAEYAALTAQVVEFLSTANISRYWIG